MSDKTPVPRNILNNPVMRYFFGEDVASEAVHFEDPFSLARKVSICGHARSEVFMFEKRQGFQEDREPVTDLNSSGIFRRIVTAHLNGLRKPKPEKTCHMGTRHVVSHFPAFNRVFPHGGLQVGKGYGLYWIRPLKVEYASHGSRGPSEGDRVISTFWIEFKNGTKGETGFMDRMKGDGGFSRWHIYPSGDVRSADLYSEHRNNHDAFRTLMADILQFEIRSEAGEAPRGDRRLTNAQRLKGFQAAGRNPAPRQTVLQTAAPTRQ